MTGTHSAVQYLNAPAKVLAGTCCAQTAFILPASDPWLCSMCRPGCNDLWGHLCLRDFDESSLYLVYKLAAWLGKRSNGIASLWLRFDGLNYQETTDTGQTRVMASTLPVLVGAMAEQCIPLHLSATGEGPAPVWLHCMTTQHEPVLAAASMTLLGTDLVGSTSCTPHLGTSSGIQVLTRTQRWWALSLAAGGEVLTSDIFQRAPQNPQLGECLQRLHLDESLERLQESSAAALASLTKLTSLRLSHRLEEPVQGFVGLPEVGLGTGPRRFPFACSGLAKRRGRGLVLEAGAACAEQVATVAQVGAATALRALEDLVPVVLRE